MLCGLDYLSPNVTAVSPQQVAERYRQVGGVPRNLFLSESKYRKLLVKQENAAAEVTEEQALRIVSGKLDVVGIALADNDHGSLTERKTVPISAAVAEQVFLKHIKTLWNDMVDNEPPLGFEPFLRTVLTRKKYEIDVSKLTEQGERTFEQSENQARLVATVASRLCRWAAL